MHMYEHSVVAHAHHVPARALMSAAVFGCVRKTESVKLKGFDLWCSAGYNSFRTKFPACVIASFRNALDRMESTIDVPCLKTDIFGCNF